MKSYRLISIIAIVCIALINYNCSKDVSVTPQTETVATTVEEKVIQGLRAASNAAIAARDSVKASVDAAPDYTIITARSFEGKGPALLRRLWYLEFTTKKEVMYVRTPDKIQVYENWNMGSEIGHWTGSWVESDGKLQLEGTYLAKWHKLNGQWKMRSEVFVPTNCKGSIACDKRPF